jgi:hypothetical protein
VVEDLGGRLEVSDCSCVFSAEILAPHSLGYVGSMSHRAQGPAGSSLCVLAVGSPSVTVYGYQTRYHSRNVKSSCSSRHKTRVWEDFREGGSLVSILSPHDCR